MNRTTNAYPQPIGSPRMMSPRSHRAAHSYRSRRVQDYPTTPQFRGDFEIRDDISEPPPPENLHRDDSAFNVDPDAPILGAGQQELREAQEAEAARYQRNSDRSFVGGFVLGLKKAFKPSMNWGSGSRQHRQYAAEADEIPYNFETPYYEPVTPLPRVPTDPESNPIDARSTSSPSSSSPTSDTMHAGPDYLDDGTTAVDHQIMMPTPAHIVNPVLVEPQPASDYAKMDSPSPSGSEVSFNTYMSRIAKFFKDLSELPWVAPERVTVDYYPGQTKRRERPRATHRPILSWYNRHAFPAGVGGGPEVSLDLTAGSSTSSPTAMQPQPLYQSFIIAPTMAAAQPPPEMPQMQQTASSIHAPSVVYTVINPSAATSSSTESTRAAAFVHRGAVDPERMYAQQISGYTPVQPNSAAFGPAVHAGYAGGVAAVST